MYYSWLSNYTYIGFFLPLHIIRFENPVYKRDLAHCLNVLNKNKLFFNG